MKAGPFHASHPVNPAFTFLFLGLLPVLTSKDAAPFGKKSVGQAKKCDEKLHINGLFCQLIVLTLQCCCVPCASKQANQWLLTVTHPPPEKNCSFVYLCCVMSILNLNSLRSNILNYWRVLFLYIWCTFHWLKLWSLQIWGWNCGLQNKKGNVRSKRGTDRIFLELGEAFYEVFWRIWNEWQENWLQQNVLVEMRGSVAWGQECMWGMFLDFWKVSLLSEEGEDWNFGS